MTREVAIEWLKRDVSRLWDTPMNNLHKEALNKAIKALEQEPCEDCISRAEVMDNYNGVETPVGYRKVVDMEVIKNMRSVYPKAKVGHWIKVVESYLPYMCSECGKSEFRKRNYCPNCGAKMEVEK